MLPKTAVETFVLLLGTIFVTTITLLYERELSFFILVKHKWFIKKIFPLSPL